MKCILLACFLFAVNARAQTIQSASSDELAGYVEKYYSAHYRSLDTNCFKGISWIKIVAKKKGGIKHLETNQTTPPAIDSFIHSVFNSLQKNNPKCISAELAGKTLIIPFYYNFSGTCPPDNAGPEYRLRMIQSGKFHDFYQDIIHNIDFTEKESSKKNIVLLHGIVLVQEDYPHGPI